VCTGKVQGERKLTAEGANLVWLARSGKSILPEYPADLTLKLSPDTLEIIWQYFNLPRDGLYYTITPTPPVNHQEVGNDLTGSMSLCERTRHVTW